MRTALAGLEVGGVQTTVPFHRWLLQQDTFTNLSGLSTEIVDRTWEPAPIVQPAALRAAELALGASLEAKPVVSGPEPAAADWWRAGVEAELERRL
jgi:acetyl/propionyl-CoA carboxylase alpha subunit